MRPEIAGVLSTATLAQALSEGRLRPPRVVSSIFDALPSFLPLLRRAPMRFRSLSGDPFKETSAAKLPVERPPLSCHDP